MKKILLLIVSLCLSLSMMAKHIDTQTAMKIAKTFIPESNFVELRSGVTYSNIYIFSSKNSFIIISADDRAIPILAYSDEFPFVMENMPDNITDWMTSLNEEIQYAIDNNIEATAEIRSDWDNLRKGIKPQTKNRAAVKPLVKTHWNQDAPYNNMCPGGSDIATGCVATAMAQVMKYWEWPRTGQGSHSYYENDYGTLSVNFSNTTYDWDNMIDEPTSSSSIEQQNAVATLMYHCGVSVDMDYGYESGAYSSDVVDALITYFDYDPNLQEIARLYYSNTEWINILKSQLNSGYPLFYSGSSEIGGHAFICDGYDANDYFHFNWGWGGYCDGYYTIDALSPGSGGIGSGSGAYNEYNMIIVNARPNTASINPPAIVIADVHGNDITINWHESTMSWNFDNDTENWTTINANNDDHTWYHSSESTNHNTQSGASHNGNGHMMSESYCNNSQQAITPDDYLVSPQKISVNEGTIFSFYACSQDQNYAAEHFGVAVSTNGNTSASSFTTISEWTINTEDDYKGNTRGTREYSKWKRYDVDLSSYAGNDVWVAIRHFNCYDQFILLVDDITVSNTSSSKNAHHYKIYRDGFVIDNNVTGNSFTDQDLPFGTYTYNVRSVLSNGDYSMMSDPAVATVVYEGPVPTNLTATKQDLNSVKLTWDAPASQNATLKYGDGQHCGSAYGTVEGNDYYWGQRFTSEQLSQYAGMAITSIQTFLYTETTYELIIYKEVDGILQQITKKSFNYNGNGSWHTITLDNPLVIDYQNNIIIAIHNNTVDYPAVFMDNYYENDNASLSSTDGLSFNSIGDISWLFRTNISNGTYTYNIYRNENQIASNVAQKNYTDQNLDYGTYQYTVRTNYYGGVSNHSEPVSISIIEPEKYNVTLSVNPNNAGTVTGAGSYYNGTTVTIAATPNIGYVFQKWTENGTLVSTDASYTFNISEHRDLVANFIIEELTLTVTDITEPSCNGGDDGSIVVKAKGGMPPYIYSLGNHTSGTTNDSYTFDNLSAGNYTIEVSDASGINKTTTIEIDEPENLSAGKIASDGEELCEEENASTITCEQQATSGQNGLTYRWKMNGNVISNSNTSEYTPSLLNEGTYTFTREVKDNCEDWMPSEGEWTVVVYNAPDVTISGNININNGESTTLTASGADSYIWNTGETTESITVNPTENKEYSVVGSFDNGCTGKASITVYVNPDAVEENNADKLEIYPNPVNANTEIYLVTECEKIKIYNALGVEVAEYENTDHIDGIEKAGIYLVKIINKGLTKYDKIIVR